MALCFRVIDKRNFKFLRRAKDKKLKADQTNAFFANKKFDKAIAIIYQSLYI